MYRTRVCQKADKEIMSEWDYKQDIVGVLEAIKRCKTE